MRHCTPAPRVSGPTPAGVPVNMENIRVWIGDQVLYSESQPHPQNEAQASSHLANSKQVVLGVDLGAGPYEVDVWTCDLSADYVRINADYRS